MNVKFCDVCGGKIGPSSCDGYRLASSTAAPITTRDGKRWYPAMDLCGGCSDALSAFIGLRIRVAQDARAAHG